MKMPTRSRTFQANKPKTQVFTHFSYGTHMAHLHEEMVDYLAKLCRVACTEEEKVSFLKELNQILEYVEKLEACDTKGIEPLASVIQGQEGLSLREDEEEEPLNRETFFSLAPAHVAGLIKVPNILE